MTKTSDLAEDLPRAKMHDAKRRFPVIWIVPVLAALIAGYLIYQRLHEFGSEITIQFQNATGLKAGQTQIEYRGVKLGEVTAVELSEDHQSALVKVHLKRPVISIANEGSTFWIVRPEVGIANITGLGTIIAGPHIEVFPGQGKPKSEFVGLVNAPLELDRDGLKIILRARRMEASKTGSPVYYRGVEVGTVSQCQLSTNAVLVEIHVLIKHRYAGLVRKGSKFWNVSGVDAKFGLIRGVQINVESLKSLLVGGITFATPDDPKELPVKDGALFILEDEPKKEWLEWSTEILVPPEP